MTLTHIIERNTRSNEVIVLDNIVIKKFRDTPIAFLKFLTGKKFSSAKGRYKNEKKKAIEMEQYGLSHPKLFGYDDKTNTIFYERIHGGNLAETYGSYEEITRSKIDKEIFRNLRLMHEKEIIFGNPYLNNILCSGERLYFCDLEDEWVSSHSKLLDLITLSCDLYAHGSKDILDYIPYYGDFRKADFHPFFWIYNKKRFGISDIFIDFFRAT